MEITKDLVLFYVLGQIADPEQRETIEKARDSDPVVGNWFALLSGNDIDSDAELFETPMDDETVASSSAVTALERLLDGCSVGSASFSQEPQRDCFGPSLLDSVKRDLSNMLADYRNSDGHDMVGASCLRRIPFESIGCERLPMAEYGMSGAAVAKNVSPSDFPDGLVIRGDAICVKLCADRIPFGVVRVFARSVPPDGDYLLGTVLLPMPRYGKIRTNRYPYRNLIGSMDPNRVHWMVLPATPEAMESFPLKDVKSMLNHRDVISDLELAQEIHLLVSQIEGNMGGKP